jgi:4-diphosphocytidyl-2-C-methyl-D-erythritol kinase
MKMPFTGLTAASCAKVNLHLAVLDKRPDGFHNLESIFLAVDFGDTLRFLPFEGENSLDIAMEGLPSPVFIPLEKNTIYKAVSLFRSKTGFTQGLRVNVEKRVPFGGGLGGGSSNAATALLVLNKLAGFPLNREQLLETGSTIGSDVPFFIYETGAAWVTGRGENIKPIEAPKRFIVLVNPGFPSSTAAAFRLLDESRNSSNNVVLNNINMVKSKKDFFSDDELFVYKNSYNDFLSVFSDPEKPVYDEIISQLLELGAQYANLSGAGSTCFGIFNDRFLAQKAALFMQNKWNFAEFCIVK